MEFSGVVFHRSLSQRQQEQIEMGVRIIHKIPELINGKTATNYSLPNDKSIFIPYIVWLAI